jgi:hypothetical protein
MTWLRPVLMFFTAQVLGSVTMACRAVEIVLGHPVTLSCLGFYFGHVFFS